MYKLELVPYETQTKAGTPHSYYVGRVLYKAGRGYHILESQSYNKQLFSHKKAFMCFMEWTEKRGYLDENLSNHQRSQKLM